MSYQVRYGLVTVRTHCDFIVLSHWGTRPPAPWPDIPLSHYWQWANKSLPYPNNAECMARKRHLFVSLFVCLRTLRSPPAQRSKHRLLWVIQCGWTHLITILKGYEATTINLKVIGLTWPGIRTHELQTGKPFSSFFPDIFSFYYFLLSKKTPPTLFR